MKTRPNVALIVETSVAYGRQILGGVARYLRAHGSWSIFLDERELSAAPPEWLLNWDGDGIICRSTTPEVAQALQERQLAVVDLNDRFRDLGFPHIGSDMPAIGRAAAEHLLERGFRHIAYCGFTNEPWSLDRLQGVKEAVAGNGKVCGVFNSSWSGLRKHRWQDERDAISAWLKALPRPLGVVACNDVRGQHVLDACRMLNIAVPEEVAVVGVDNSETFCELCDPPLSSVLPNAERIGFEAAALLSQLMDGKPPPKDKLRIAPNSVIARQSSDVLAIDDPAVALALRYIREHIREGISVSDITAQTLVSRSTLERKFRHFLGHSPQEEIRRTRLKRVKQLMLDTDWPLDHIAEVAGFEHPEYMMVQFKRSFGQTPTQWRQLHTVSF